ncbi:MAG: M28 family peptidase, partial [Defluviitaleaceae bacterium]|nr:M28 family peptidase [Defluviitaleaceae bacterium]
AHYDSVALSSNLNPNFISHSYGAADAGYGVVTMLEVARYFAGRDLENTIYFLFTDLHEIGLFGAHHAISNMDFSNVSMILNLEARGIRGPVYMFETAGQDFEVVRFFRDALAARGVQPMTYSIATAVFGMMPNGSDLTLFFREDFAGMNFAPLNSIRYYHTYRDSLDNISLTTMQHYVDTILALTYAFATNPQFGDIDAFASNRAGVYFSLPFGLMVLYSDTTALVLALVALVGVIALGVLLRNKISIKKVGIWMGVLLIAVALAAGVGLLVSFIISLITGDAFSLVFMPNAPELAIMLPVTVVVFALFAFMHKLFKGKFNKNEMTLGSMVLLALLTIGLQFVMVEATFLTLVPLGFTLLFFGLSTIPQVKENQVSMLLCAAMPLVVTMVIIVPAMISFVIALTIGGLAVPLALGILMSITLPPLWMDI